MLGENLDEATLKDILLACLSEAGKQTQKEGFEDGPKASKGPGCLPGAAEPLDATPEDVAAAAKYVVQRFGKRPGKGDAAAGGVSWGAV